MLARGWQGLYRLNGQFKAAQTARPAVLLGGWVQTAQNITDRAQQPLQTSSPGTHTCAAPPYLQLGGQRKLQRRIQAVHAGIVKLLGAPAGEEEHREARLLQAEQGGAIGVESGEDDAAPRPLLQHHLQIQIAK
jgi:UDP-N-acetyl-D-mannosaminuronic acid transferase (WecB/TagA/CpsF family)